MIIIPFIKLCKNSEKLLNKSSFFIFEHLISHNVIFLVIFLQYFGMMKEMNLKKNSGRKITRINTFLLSFNQIKQLLQMRSNNTTIQAVEKVILNASSLTKNLFRNRLVQEIIHFIVYFKVFVAFLETSMIKSYRKRYLLFQITVSLWFPWFSPSGKIHE